MKEKKCCIFINKKTGKGCNIKKIDENELCIRHRKKNKNENEEKIIEKKDDIYKEMYEEPEIENEEIEEIEEIKECEKKEASPAEIQMIKYGYLAIIGWTEMFAPDHLKGAKDAVEKDVYIDEILKEVANDYSDVIGFSNMDPGVKLLVVTAMTLGTVAAINSKSKKNIITHNDNNNVKKLEEDIEKQFNDI